jgi:hypothetical protein
LLSNSSPGAGPDFVDREAVSSFELHASACELVVIELFSSWFSIGRLDPRVGLVEALSGSGVVSCAFNEFRCV